MELFGRYDLHLHTNSSDGSLSPRETVRAAADAGLEGIAVTDHDTVNGLGEAMEAGREFGISVVPGVEISSDGGSAEIHILGFLFNAEDPAMADVLRRCRACRSSRIEAMVDKLRACGYGIEYSRVVELSGGQGSMGRPHVADALVEMGYVGDRRAAFDELLSPGRPGYIPRDKPLPTEAISVIRGAGGIAVLAHPGLDGMGSQTAELAKSGLQGLEVYHTVHTSSQEQDYLRLAQELGLLVTGGSDSHGPGKKGGAEMGDRTVGRAELERLVSVRTALSGQYPCVGIFA